MTGALDTIYSTIAAWSFTVGGKAAGCLYDSTLKDTLGAADLPVRMLLPVRNALEGGGQRALTLNAAYGRVEWHIDDLLLLKPATQGRGLEDVAGDLVAYVRDYSEQALTATRLTTGATITNVEPRSGVFEWPADGGRHYYGVVLTLTIMEVFSAT